MPPHITLGEPYRPHLEIQVRPFLGPKRSGEPQTLTVHGLTVDELVSLVQERVNPHAALKGALEALSSGRRTNGQQRIPRGSMREGKIPGLPIGNSHAALAGKAAFWKRLGITTYAAKMSWLSRERHRLRLVPHSNSWKNLTPAQRTARVAKFRKAMKATAAAKKRAPATTAHPPSSKAPKA